MFHRLFIIIPTIFVFLSCATGGQVEEQVEEQVSETVSEEPIVYVYAPDEAKAAEEIILFENLEWSSPNNFHIVLDKKTPLPFYKPHRKTAKAVVRRPVEEDVDSVAATTVTDTPARAAPVIEEEVVTIAVAETHSFLEMILNSDKTEDDDVVLLEQRAEQAEPMMKLSTEEVVSDEVEHDIAEPVAAAEFVQGAVHEVYILECDAEGWLLDEITDLEGMATDRLRYNGRDYVGGKTLFSFYPYSSGFYLIKLRKPDFYSGTTSIKIVELEAVLSLETEKIVEVEVEAVNEEEIFLKDYEEISSLSQYEEKLLPAEPSDAAGIISAVIALESAGDCIGAVDLLKDGINEVDNNELDLLYFRLGGLYENCSGARDERAAIEVYKKIVDYYPISNYWIEAKERIIYLERNFIHIR